MRDTRKIITLVLGVHRSGTSLLTAGLLAAGLSTGEFDDTYDDDNPHGYNEHPEVRQFNDRLLAHLGASWDNWGFYASVAGLVGPALAPWRDQAVALLQRIFPGPGPWALKDPRILTLLPFWEAVVPAAGFDLQRILILRNPAEVAESQRQRAVRRPLSFPLLSAPEPMAALWTVAMHGALVSLGDDHTLMVGHAGLMSDPVGTLAACATHLRLTPDAAALQAFAVGQVRSDLYRARVTGPPAGTWSREATGLFRALVKGGLPRRLMASEARALASGRRRLKPLLSTLPAVAAVVQSMQTDRAQAMKALAVEPLRQLAWGLSAALARKTPDSQLAVLRDAIAGMIDQNTSDVAVLNALARIEEHLGNWIAAEVALQQIERVHPGNPIGPQLLAGFANRRAAAERP